MMVHDPTWNKDEIDDDDYDFDGISLPRLKTNREETRIFNDEAWNEFAGRNLNSRKQDATKTHVERPMTAMSGAGYRKNGTGNGRYDYHDGEESTMISSKTKKSDVGPNILLWKKELEIHNLIEQSATYLSNGALEQALDLAQQAGKMERLYVNYLQSKSIAQESAVKLTFATWFNLAVVYEKSEMMEEAIQAFTYLINQKKFQAYAGVVRVQLGNIYYNQQSYDDAIKMYKMAADIFSRDNQGTSGKLSAKIGNAYARQGNFQQAIHHYENAVRSCQSLEPMFNLLLCHSIIGSTEEAKKIFLKLAAASTKGYIHSCLIRYKRIPSGLDSFVNDPLEDYLQMMTRKTASILLSAAHVLVLIARDNRIKVETFTWIQNQLKDHFPEIAAKIEINHAMHYMYNYNFDLGTKMLKAFEKKDSDTLSLASVNLSCIYFLEKNSNKANLYADMALERNRFNAMALVNKGNVLFLQDDIGLARECYQEAVNVHSTCPEAIYNLGLSYIRLGRDKDAMDVFENLLTISPNDPSVLYQVACICERQQNWAMALKWLNILSTRVPADATTKMKFDTLMDKLGTE